ncbi:hypothetical protein Moror_13224 [Moniliophthora roreri MCA 2997]|uniref:Uncharacterized protein n=1 Tax=Moniliophthora roreri (strain MCA 2997) TaxID=1381753 RepID=V2X571_MONRO|nr:hypothetical protein Moror_13224 [Moniliophthora roreri MCA 2997]
MQQNIDRHHEPASCADAGGSSLVFLSCVMSPSEVQYLYPQGTLHGPFERFWDCLSVSPSNPPLHARARAATNCNDLS